MGHLCITMANTNLILNESRGGANHGWLNAKHSFSFAGYHNPERMHFGALRVLNDDTITAGMGFGTHPHDNMEIITIPLLGVLEHTDSMGNSGIVSEGEVQVMSAGTGIKHSEKNASNKDELKLLQIWLFPNKQNVSPRYQQMSVANEVPNAFHQILSPNQDDDAGLWIHQDAWFHLGHFDRDISVSYVLKNKNNGVYAFVIDGEAQIADMSLHKRDALTITDAESFNIQATSGARILLMEVPL